MKHGFYAFEVIVQRRGVNRFRMEKIIVRDAEQARRVAEAKGHNLRYVIVSVKQI